MPVVASPHGGATADTTSTNLAVIQRHLHPLEFVER
jgi:hypothetical protein